LPRPVIGNQVPRRGNPVTRGLGSALLAVFGWRIDGNWPDQPKLVAIIAPHTSNWDFFFGICAIFAIGIRVNWIGKHTLFRRPFGGFMRWLGGTPVDREMSSGRVDQTIALIEQRESFILGVSPEGTRKRVARWRSGFYHVAAGARVPIQLTYLDYSRRVVGIGPTFEPTGDEQADLDSIRSFYDVSWARHPQQF
jgi:1-acyl-sn-glycerol-3-phosphate acyltransferase